MINTFKEYYLSINALKTKDLMCYIKNKLDIKIIIKNKKIEKNRPL